MAERIDLGRVLAKDYTPAPGHEYEISHGNWGKMRIPTAGLQEKVINLGDEATATQVVSIVLEGLKQYDPSDAIMGMEVAAARDFFNLLTEIAKAVNPDYSPSGETPVAT